MRINTLVGDNRIYGNINSLNKQKVEDNSEKDGLSFISELRKKLDEVNEDQLKAEAVTEAFVKGEDVDIHQVMLINEEAKLSLQMAVQVRNKLVEAYQELNRMQL
jgi:flagellar hook-basal body complex protein FliE